MVEDDIWTQKVDQDREELKQAPLVTDERAPEPQPAGVDTLYGEIAMESTEVSKITEEVREKANAAIRRLDKALSEMRDIPTIRELKRSHPGWIAEDCANHYRNVLQELVGNITQDRTIFKIVVGETVQIDVLNKPQRRRNP